MGWDTGSARTHGKKQFLLSFAQLDPTAANLCYSILTRLHMVSLGVFPNSFDDASLTFLDSNGKLFDQGY
jgi:hypothetical protein